MWSNEIDCKSDKQMPWWLKGNEQLQVVSRVRMRKRVTNGPACKVDWKKARSFRVWLDLSRRPSGARWWYQGEWFADGQPALGIPGANWPLAIGATDTRGGD